MADQCTINNKHHHKDNVAWHKYCMWFDRCVTGGCQQLFLAGISKFFDSMWILGGGAFSCEYLSIQISIRLDGLNLACWKWTLSLKRKCSLCDSTAGLDFLYSSVSRRKTYKRAPNLQIYERNGPSGYWVSRIDHIVYFKFLRKQACTYFRK